MKITIAAALAGSILFAASASADIVVSSYCPMTKVKGMGHGATFSEASQKAIQACMAKGGLPECCNKFVRQVN
jgi:hypothetical protein